ncbi:MAG: uroporphyrinogen decarboxylase family protein [Candidatus Bipolaricaulota bacterium]|nr:hypothetical protein [Candidatus Bipolaricaulota bacterium]
MNSKERVRTALRLKEPDRVPIFATLTTPVAERVGKYLGISPDIKEAFLADRVSHTDILLELGNDCVGISASYPDNHPVVELGEGRKRDEWGIIYEKRGPYWEAVGRPLANITDESDLESYEFPDIEAPGRFREARDSVAEYGNEYALVASIECTMFELAWSLVGFDKFLTDLAKGKTYTRKLLDRIAQYSIESGKRLIDIGADLVWTGDDFGTQEGMLISPDIWREVFKPRYERVFTELKKKDDEVLVAYHSCGSIRPIIGDLVEIGLDILNPIQPRARDMDLADIKSNYGDKLGFFGGVDIQRVLPNASPDEVRNHIKGCIKDGARGGGYLLAPAHNIQPDTPVENIIAMFEAVKEFGAYPL